MARTILGGSAHLPEQVAILLTCLLCLIIISAQFS